jgi:hypothetical protein
LPDTSQPGVFRIPTEYEQGLPSVS